MFAGTRWSETTDERFRNCRSKVWRRIENGRGQDAEDKNAGSKNAESKNGREDEVQRTRLVRRTMDEPGE